MSIEIKGLNELNAKLGQIAKIAPKATASELADVALDLGSKCSDAAPILNGDLRGDLANPRKEGDLDWKVGSDLPYTARQHEHTEYSHPKGGGAKFLEKPFRENVNKYIDAIGEAIVRNLK
ncbi:hypothetical protein [Terrisporobacter sp.]|uniref:hypothetical protein n=1 Tax=Terrisporobacter sp. TaxID=1965305 RepID=UPI0026214F2F|nr:hypothetical protein [Terrisporobacter sp.]